jgi:hypothetical protein
MFKSFQNLVVIGLVVFGLTACSKDSGGGAPLKEAPASDFNTKSCLFDLTEGGAADFAVLGTSEITKMYFDKEINSKYLGAIAKASVDSSIQFVNQTGATVFKSAAINTNKCSKPLFAQAQGLTADLGKEWMTATADDGDETGYTLGLFMAQGNYFDLPSLKSTAAIIVRENTNRWTLVHEFMHHLFHLRAEETGYDESQVLRDSRKASDDMDAIIKKGLSSDSVPALAEAYSRYAKAIDSRLVHYTLEEMTIESEMKDAHTVGDLQYAPLSSNFYINSNGVKGLKSLENIQKLGDSIKGMLGKSNPVELAMVESTLATIEARKATIMSLMAKYKYDLAMRETNPAIYAADVAEAGCSHGKEADLILAETRALAKLVRKIPVVTK